MKKRLIAAALVLCLILPVATTGIYAAETPITITAQADGMTIQSVDVEGATYLFLPSTVDLTKLNLTFTQGTKTLLTEKNLNVPSLIQKDSSGRYSLKTTFKSGDVLEYYIMQGSEIPTIYLTSKDSAQGREWVDKSKKNEAKGTMKLIEADGDAIYDGELTQIKARGNSTFTYFPKKAYQIKLKDKTDLLGTGEKVKTWVLLANYGDATLMHDKLFKELASELGMPYVVSTGWVNLYYDGEYRGVYLLSEKNDVGGSAVDITDMEEAYEAVNPTYGDDMKTAEATNSYGQKYLYTKNLTEVDDVTGGWLFELNLQKVDEASGFYTRQERAINIKSPEYAGKEAMEYISEYYQAFEDAVFATDASGNYTGYNEQTKKYYYEYVDATSLVQTFLMQELALNPDGFFSSQYFYKDTNGILSAGPIWDQDMTLGTGWNIYISPKVQDYHYLAAGLVKIPDFEQRMVTYFYNKFLPIVEQWLGSDGKIARYKALLQDSTEMNYVLWPYVRVGNPEKSNHLWGAGTNYDTVTADMVSWVEQRIGVLKNTFDGSQISVGRFPDTAGHWAEEAINFVADRGIFGGTDKGFEPELPMNRAMLVTTLYRVEGEPKEGSHDFADVPADAWYNDAVAWANGAGVVLGDAAGFLPNANLTREQLAVMFYRYAAACGVDTAVRGELNAFSDFTTVSDWATEAMQWAVGIGLINGIDGKLEPQGNTTRAQVATIYQRFLTQVMH